MYLILLLKLFVIVPTTIVLIYACRELIVYQNLNHFRKQGVKCFYIPILGVICKFTKSRGSTDQLAGMKQVLQENINEKLIVFNTLRSVRPAVFLINQDIIREFFVKELDCSIKTTLNKHAQMGFFFQNGELMVEARQAYATFFNYNNLRTMTKEISSILDSMMNKYKKEISQTEWTKVDIKVYLDDIFSELVNSILFGETKQRYIEEKSLTLTIKEYLNECFLIAVDPLNLVCFDLLNSYSLLKSTRDCHIKFDKIQNTCWEIYEDRKKTGPKDIPNLLDLLILLNQERSKIGKAEMTKTEIAGHFVLLQFAGSDTSHELTSNTIYYLSKTQDVREKFTQIVDQVFAESQVGASDLTSQQYEKVSAFESYCDEFIRVFAPIPLLSIRELIKDITLGEYSLKKGDRINIMGSLIMHLEKNYPQGENFDPVKLEEVKKAPGKKPLNIAFGIGKRICIGKSLAEMIVKLILAHFCKNFELEHDATYSESRKMKLTYGFDVPTVLLRPRHPASVSPL